MDTMDEEIVTEPAAEVPPRPAALGVWRNSVLEALVGAIDSCIAQEGFNPELFEGFLPATFKADILFTFVREDGTEGVRELKCIPELLLTDTTPAPVPVEEPPPPTVEDPPTRVA